MKESLTKQERLGKKNDLSKIFVSGGVEKCYGAKILFLENSFSYSRFAVTLVRKFGNAIERNYTKRIFREFFRTNKNSFNKCYDVVIVLYPGKFTYLERKKQFFSLIKRANLVKDN